MGAARLRAGLDPPAAWALRQLENLRATSIYPVLWMYALTDQHEAIDRDAERWAEVLLIPDRKRLLARLLYAFPEFRGIYYHRLSTGNPAGRLAGRLAARIWKSVPGLDLSGTPIGPGLFISHGQGTVLSAERIGADLWVHQGVTVGWDYQGARRPVIGDNVFIGAGAKILGAIDVGDGSRIGANAVVVCDVPAGATAVGIPAQIRLRSGDPDQLGRTEGDAAT
jgi:serine O-acetyltransferase